MSDNLLFNWGGHTPEQQAMQRRLEELALMEQVVRVKMSQSGQTGGVGGGSTINQVQAQTLETVLLLVKEYQGNTTNYTYYVADYKKNTLSGPFDTGISFEDYSISDDKGLQDKGYFFLFRLIADPNDYKMLFLDASGTILGLKEGYTSDLTIDYFGGRWLVANDYDARYLWYFDGETLTENLTYLQTADVGFTIGSNFDGANASGFTFKTTKTNGDNTFCFGTNTGITEIFSYNTVAAPDLNYSLYLYNMSNVAVIEEFDSSTNFYGSLKFISASTGILLEEYSVSAGGYANRDSYAYGDGNYVWIFYNEVDYLVVNYRVATGTLETAIISSTDYPNWNLTRDTFSLYSYVPYPILDTFSIVFYNSTGSLENLTTMSACKIVYSIDNGTLSEYDLKTPGPGTINSLANLTLSKNTALLLTDTFGGEYTAVVFTNTLTYVHPLGIEISTYNSYDVGRAGEKIIFYFNLDSGDSEFFVISANGATCTQSSIAGQTLTLLVTDYDAVVVRNTFSEWRLNGATDSLVAVPRFQTWLTSDPYTNPQLREIGLIVEFDQNRVAYTHTQMTDPPVNSTSEAVLEDFAMDGAVVAGNQYDFGVGSSYFTNLYPGMFVLCAKGINIESFSISGNIGADGGGDVDNYDFQTTISGQLYTAFVKRVFNSGDPSINHIIIVKGDGSGISQSVDLGSDADTHIIAGITSSVNEIHYLLLSQDSGVKIDDPEISLITDAYLTIVHGKNINTTLADLNVSYEDVTNNVLAPYFFNDVPEDPNSIDDGGGDMYDGANFIQTNRSPGNARFTKGTSALTIADFAPSQEIIEFGPTMVGVLYFDPQNSGKVSVKIYSLAGVLKQYIKTPHFEYQDFDIVGNRAILVVKDKEFDGFNIYYNTTIYSITPTSYKTKSYKTLDSNGFERRAMNDTTWYD